MARDADPRNERIRLDLELHLRRTDPDWRVIDVALLPQGHSGFTYRVAAADHRGDRSLVLRVPPPGTRPLGPADVARQGRIVASLKRLGFPVPSVVAQSGKPDVDGRPFVLFEMVPGLRIEEVQARVDGARLTAGAVETLARLHRIPVEEVEIGKEPISLAAELTRWQDLLQRARADLDVPHVELRSSLATSIPDAHQPCVVHGDYHCGNLLFNYEGAVVAVLDWEIAELGQPLIDLGCLAVAGMSRGTNRVGPVPGPEVEPEQLALLYGADPREFEWYCAFSCYKYAAVYTYNLMLHRRGKRIDPFNEGLEPLIARLLHRGLGLLAR
jgi:aminoglycoside phosphotransferase (APT) family kinase protein